MSSYSKSTDFAAKDSLPSGNANKVVSGTEINTEFNAIETAVNSKANTASPTFTGIVSAGTVNIDGGNIDGTVIGSASAAAGTFTTITGTAITGTSLVIGAADVTEAELEILDGATVTTAELNVLDGITATTAELNILDGVTATFTELNVLDGITATTAELNYTDGVTSAIQTQLNTKAPLASPTFTGTATLPTVDINAGNIDGTVIGAAAAAAGSFTTVTASGAITGASLVIGAADVSEAELEILDGATVTTAELNVLDGITATTAELNYTDGVTSAIQTQMDLKAPLADPNFTGTAEVGTMDIASGSITDSSGAIDFGNENLSTTGTFSCGTLTASGEITANGGIALGDNDKAIFGAGSDLQIYHDGSNSYVKDAGTGDLYLQGSSNVQIESAAGANMIYATAGAQVRLFYNGSPKLDTTSTGIDVTGTATMDGLTVDAAGDVAFGTKFFWDASAESLGIGTSSPSETLSVENVSNNAILLNSPANRYNAVGFQSAGVDKWWMGRADTDIIAGNAFFIGGDAGNATDAGGFSARLVIDSSGNVGIGTSSPASLVAGGSSPVLSIGGADATLTTGEKAGSLSFISADTSFTPTYADGIASEIVCVSDSAVGGAYGLAFYTATTGGSNRGERMRIDSSGNLLVGTTTTDRTASPGITLAPAGFIDVSRSGTIAGRFTRKVNDGSLIDFRKESTTVGSISVTGSATAYNTSSDYRLKEDDVPMTGATERVKALRPINFAWKATGERVDGFFAHEAQEVVPECVTGTKDAMMDEEYEVTPAVYEDVIIPAVEAVEGVEAVEAVEAVDAVYDEKGELVSEAIEAVEAVEGVEAVEAQEETTKSVLVTEAVMGTRSVPDMQGIDQSKLVPLLTATIQELIERIEALEAGA